MPVFCHQDLDLHYLARGFGEPVLLIHGLGSSSADWAFQMSALESRFHVIAPDLPGSGLSAPLNSGCAIESFAEALWSLLDSLEVTKANIVGFSLGGAVALEMALQRPAAVPRLALINSLASYRIDHWRKWLEARIPEMLVRFFGIRRAAQVAALRMFPDPWQRQMRDRAVAAVSAVPTVVYLAMAKALEHWTAIERLELIQSRTLLIAGEHDYMPMQDKRALAAQLHASIVVASGSHHGTPFDSVELTNACLIAWLSDQALPSSEHWSCDARNRLPPWPLESRVDQHDSAIAGAGVNI
jgi:pimeloyl-ACP methyl ester carboxylesterase